MLCLGLGCLLLLRAFLVFGSELTFELPDNEKQCFYEELEKDTKFVIDFQVSRSQGFATSQNAAKTRLRLESCYLGGLCLMLLDRKKTILAFGSLQKSKYSWCR